MVTSRLKASRPRRDLLSIDLPALQSSEILPRREILSSGFSVVKMSSAASGFTAKRLLLSCLHRIARYGINCCYKQDRINRSSGMRSLPSVH